MTTMDTVDPAVDDAQITAFFAADPETIAWPYPMYERWRHGHRRGPLAGRPGDADHALRRRQGRDGRRSTRSGRTPTGSASWPRGRSAGCRSSSTRSSSRSSTSRASSCPGRTATSTRGCAGSRPGRSPPAGSSCCASRSSGTSTTSSRRCGRAAARRQAAPRQQAAGAGDRRPDRHPAVRPRPDLGVVRGGRPAVLPRRDVAARGRRGDRRLPRLRRRDRRSTSAPPARVRSWPS